MHEMFALTASEILPLNPTLVLVSISLFIILIVETGRLPVDNPATHLELTMINEAMILEQTGKNLALLELSHALKQLLLMGILINTILPIGLSTEFDLGKIVISSVLFLLKAGMLAIIVGLFESSLAKMRLFRLPAFYVMAFFFSALTILIEVFA
jgi:formate hydrogenlyase subunit 4